MGGTWHTQAFRGLSLRSEAAPGVMIASRAALDPGDGKEVKVEKGRRGLGIGAVVVAVAPVTGGDVAAAGWYKT